MRDIYQTFAITCPYFMNGSDECHSHQEYETISEGVPPAVGI